MSKVNNKYTFNLTNRQGTLVPGEVSWNYEINYSEKTATINIDYIQFTYEDITEIANIVNSSVACNLSINSVLQISNADFSSNAAYYDENGKLLYKNLTGSNDYYINEEGYIVYKNNGSITRCSSGDITLSLFDSDEIVNSKKLVSFILNLKLRVTAPTSYYSIGLSEKEELISIAAPYTPCVAPTIVENSKFVTPRGKCSITWTSGSIRTKEEIAAGHSISSYLISCHYYVDIGTGTPDKRVKTKEVLSDKNTVVLDFNEIIENTQSFLQRGSEIELRVSTESNIDSFYNSVYSKAIIEVVNNLPNEPTILLSSSQDEIDGVLTSKVSPGEKILIHAEPGDPNNKGQNSYVYYKRYTDLQALDTATLIKYDSIIEEQVNSDVYYSFYTYDESFVTEDENYQLEYSNAVQVHIIKNFAPYVKKIVSIYTTDDEYGYHNNKVKTTLTTDSDVTVTRIVWYIRYAESRDTSSYDITEGYQEKVILSEDVSSNTTHTYTYTCNNIKQLLDIPYGYYYQIGAVLINDNLYGTQLVLSNGYWEAETLESTRTYKVKGSVYDSTKLYFSDEKSKINITPSTSKITTINWSINDITIPTEASGRLYGAFPDSINTPEIVPRHSFIGEGSSYNKYYEDGTNNSEDDGGVKIKWNSTMEIPGGFSGFWYQFYYRINDGDWISIGSRQFFNEFKDITYEDVKSHGGSNGCTIQYRVYIYRDISDDAYTTSEISNQLVKVKRPQWRTGQDSFAYINTDKPNRKVYIRPNYSNSYGSLRTSLPGFGNDLNLSSGHFRYEIWAKTSLENVCFSSGQLQDERNTYTINSDNFTEAIQEELFGEQLNSIYTAQFYMIFYDKFEQSIFTKNIVVYVDYREAPKWGEGNLLFGRTIKFEDTFTDNNPNYFINNSASTKISNFTALSGQYLTIKFPNVVDGYNGQKLKYIVELHEVNYNTNYVITSEMSSSSLIASYSFLSSDIPEVGEDEEKNGIRRTDNDTWIEYRFTQLTSDLIGTARALGVQLKVYDQLNSYEYTDNNFSKASSYLVIGCTLSKPDIVISRSTCEYENELLTSTSLYNITWPSSLLKYQALEKNVDSSVTHSCTVTFEYAEGGGFTKKKEKEDSSYKNYTNVYNRELVYEDESSGTTPWVLTTKTLYIRIKLVYYVTDLKIETIYSQPFICYMEGPTISSRYHAVGINNTTLGADITPISVAISSFVNGTILRKFLIMTDLATTDPQHMLAYNHMTGELYVNTEVYENLCMQESELSEFDE